MNSNKIKVFFFIDSFRIGGMHRQLLYLVKYIDKQRYEPIMCTSNSKGGLLEEYEKTGCKLINLKWKRSFDPAIALRLLSVLYSEKPNIIFICEAQNFIYFRAANLFYFKRIVQIGSFRALTFWKGHLKKYYKPIDNLFSKWLYNTSNSVIVNSMAMKDHYSQIIKINQEKSIQVIYNGSDFNFPVTKKREQIKEELNIPFDEFIIIMVARLDPWKDFETFLEAAKILTEYEKKINFLIVGDGELRKNLEKLIITKELTENVMLIYEKKDVFNYINASDISVLSTHGEGFSNSVLESMAMCKPVIATNVGGNPDAIGINGEAGILVEPKSPQLLADAILYLIKNKDIRTTMGKAAQNRINKLCSIDTMVESYENTFQMHT